MANPVVELGMIKMAKSLKAFRSKSMKLRILTLLCCLSFTLMTSAQASGGQIRRPTKTQQTTRKEVDRNINTGKSETPPTTPSHKARKTYTAREMYEMGLQFYDKSNYTEAMSWFLKAAENGYSDAQSELGFMYMNGEGVPVNKPEGAKWLIKAGENGDAMAQRALGFMYKNGDGVYKSESESQKWFRKAAPQFYESARKLMRSATGQAAIQLFGWVYEMGQTPYNVWSLFHIGEMYYFSEGDVDFDFPNAFKYFSMAADNGNKPAMYFLGLCYKHGRGTQIDLIKAKEYFKRSGYELAPSRDF